MVRLNLQNFISSFSFLDTGITVARAYGEYMVRQNLSDIRSGCNILCACIGRLMHFVRNGEIHLRDVQYLICDEADRLLQENSNSDVLQLFQWNELPEVSLYSGEQITMLMDNLLARSTSNSIVQCHPA